MNRKIVLLLTLMSIAGLGLANKDSSRFKFAVNLGALNNVYFPQDFYSINPTFEPEHTGFFFEFNVVKKRHEIGLGFNTNQLSFIFRNEDVVNPGYFSSQYNIKFIGIPIQYSYYVAQNKWLQIGPFVALNLDKINDMVVRTDKFDPKDNLIYSNDFPDYFDRFNESIQQNVSSLTLGVKSEIQIKMSPLSITVSGAEQYFRKGSQTGKTNWITFYTKRAFQGRLGLEYNF